jgi:hypothetical protein
MNHAFPLCQPLCLNAWTKREIQVLVYHSERSTPKINITCQQELAELGFVRNIKGIQCKRRKLGLTVPRGPATVEVAASDINEDSCDGTEIPPKDPAQNEQSVEEKIEAIAEQVVGAAGDLERGMQVDEFFEFLEKAGIQLRRTVCVKIFQELFPMDLKVRRRWSDEQTAIGLITIATQTARLSKSQMAIELSRVLTNIGTPKSVAACSNFIVARLPKTCSSNHWTGPELALLDIAETTNSTMEVRERGLILSEKLLHSLGMAKTASACSTKIAEVWQQRKETPGEEDQDEEATEDIPTREQRKKASEVEGEDEEAMEGTPIREPRKETSEVEGEDEEAMEDTPIREQILDTDKSPRTLHFRVPKNDPRWRRGCTEADIKLIINQSFSQGSTIRAQGCYRHVTAPSYFTTRGFLRKASKNVISLWSRQAKLEPKDDPEEWDKSIWTPSTVHSFFPYKEDLIALCGEELFGTKEQNMSEPTGGSESRQELASGPATLLTSVISDELLQESLRWDPEQNRFADYFQQKWPAISSLKLATMLRTELRREFGVDRTELACQKITKFHRHQQINREKRSRWTTAQFAFAEEFCEQNAQKSATSLGYQLSAEMKEEYSTDRTPKACREKINTYRQRGSMTAHLLQDERKIQNGVYPAVPKGLVAKAELRAGEIIEREVAGPTIRQALTSLDLTPTTAISSLSSADRLWESRPLKSVTQAEERAELASWSSQEIEFANQFQHERLDVTSWVVAILLSATLRDQLGAVRTCRACLVIVTSQRDHITDGRRQTQLWSSAESAFVQGYLSDF